MRTRYILIIISVVLLGSCKKSFLELDNPSNITTAGYWKTEDDLKAGIATIYSALVDDYNGHYGTINFEMRECKTENFDERFDVRDRYTISTFANTADNGVSQPLYFGAYVCIYRANQCIENGALMNLAESVKNPLVAEAKFLRGLNYWVLVSDFGSVPLITKVPKSPADFVVGKSSKDSIWQQVISDLKYAEQYLPATWDAANKGRATKGAAAAYLGRVYLYKAYDDAGNANAMAADYTAAQTELKSIVDNEVAYGYGLQANFAELFDGKHENGPEGVFEIEFAEVGGASIWTSDPASKTRGTFVAQEILPESLGGWGEMTPTHVLLDKFLVEADKNGNFDARATATLAWDYPGCTYYQKDFHSTWPGQVLLKKNQNWWNTNEGNWISSLNEFGMRYADVLLMLAEAYTMNNQVALAAPLVQRVRDRANLVDLSATMAAYTQAQMMDQIKKQRDLEFVREGLHFYDLRRWGDLQSAVTNAQKTGYLNYTSKFEYYPIPTAELLNNAAMTQSDPWK